MKTNRREEFDVLRALMIISAIILHFNNKFDLGSLALPSIFVQKQLFNVGSFFFFASGYMACKIYLPKFQKGNKKTATKIFKKSLEILFTYVGYITFMRLATGNLIPLHLYSFLFEHKFFTLVLFTFSVIFLISPSIIMIYERSKSLFLSFIFLLLGFYTFVIYAPIPENLMNSELTGILFGVGIKHLYYPIIPALIIYCLGFLIASYDGGARCQDRRSNALIWSSFLLLVIHSALCILSEYYRTIVHIKLLAPLVTSILIFISLLLIRYLLEIKKIRHALTKSEFILIGQKTLTFYVTSNMILSFLSLSEHNNILIKIVMFGCLFWLTYLVTKWSFYTDLVPKKVDGCMNS